MPELAVSLASLLSEARKALRAAGVADPAREALRLWAELNGEAFGVGLLDPARPVDASVAARFQAALGRRAQGEPLAYVTGWAGFRRLELRIDQRALIPRPETEGLVDLLLERAPRGRVADIGTGSGCIALSLATEGGYDAIVAVDRSADALALAAVNRALIGAAVELVRGDLTTALAPGSFDALVSNPPYVTESEHAVLDPAVSGWEPREALVSGPDGLDAMAGLLDDGRRVLRPGGWLALELDPNRAAAVAALARGLGWESVDVRADLFGRERYLLARRSEHRDLGQGTGAWPAHRPDAGVSGAATRGDKPSRGSGHPGQARPDPAPGTSGGSDGGAGANARPANRGSLRDGRA